MTDASSSFELLEFEQVQAGAKTVLLRLAARPSPAVTLERLTLVLDGGDGPVRLTPLPAPTGPTDPVRIAFAAAPELLRDVVSFTLELHDGSTFPLPSPTLRDQTRRRAAARPPERAEDPRLAEAEQLAASRRLAIVELQRRLGAEHSRRTTAETEARRARTNATAEAAVHVELQTRLAEAEAESARTRTALDSVKAELERTAADLGQINDQLTERDAQLTERDAQLSERDAQLTERTAQLTERTAQLSERDAELAGATEELERERASRREELEAANASAEELRAQVTELGLRLEDEQERLEAAEADLQAGREQFAGVEAELAGVRAAAEEVAAALADRTTEVELLRDGAVARELELEDEYAAGRHGFEAELAEREQAAALAWDAVAASADVLLARAAEIELLRVASAERPAPAVAETPLAPATAAAAAAAATAAAVGDTGATEALERELGEARRTLAETEQALAEARQALTEGQQALAEGQQALAEAGERATAAEAAKEETDRKLEQTLEARRLPPELAAYERELIELRGAVERAQNRARLHRQHSGTLESELNQAKQELTELRQQVAAVTRSPDEAASVGEVEALREQVAYGQALAADLEWQLDEARATEEAADAALAIRAAEVELLSQALRALGTGAPGEH